MRVHVDANNMTVRLRSMMLFCSNQKKSTQHEHVYRNKLKVYHKQFMN